ncbi:MAG: hypothetical protein IJX86_04290, partial [Lachnospiraceae bacterium]|nr:hypothetical protein [Lachnospiraceae bacterium]
MKKGLMKRILATALAFVLVLGVAAVNVEKVSAEEGIQVGDDLIVDGSFESYDDFWSNGNWSFTGETWSVVGSGSNNIELETGDGKVSDGTYALKFYFNSDAEGGTITVEQTIASLPAGT